MAYNWAQLGFVERWRLNAVRGPIVGMYRSEERTFFDLRLQAGEGGSRLSGPVELHLLDAGNIILEKRITLLAKQPVVVRVVASSFSPPPGDPTAAPPPGRGRPRRWLETDTRIPGTVVEIQADVALVDVGFPVVVQLPEEASASGPEPGRAVEFTVSETPKGFFVI